MKILICAHDSNIVGGSNRSLLMVIDGLIKKIGADNIEVVLPRKKGSLNDALKDRNIKTHVALYFGATSGLRNDGKDILRIFKICVDYLLESVFSIILSIKLKKSKFDLVYTNGRSPIIGAKIAKYIHLPHIIHIREFGADKPLWGFWGHKKLCSMSSKVILISYALQKEYLEYTNRDNLVVIHNGINYLPVSHYTKHDFSKSINLLLTGRIVPDKGHLDAINAIKILKDKINLHLYIAGSTPKNMHIEWYEKYIKKIISKENLKDYITFCGETKNMKELRNRMDVELMCSTKETFGRVTVEGMRDGLLLIGSNTGGTPEIINNMKTGLLYNQGNHRDLADKIMFVYQNPNIANEIARRGYEYCKTSFLPEDNIEKIYNVLSQTSTDERFNNKNGYLY